MSGLHFRSTLFFIWSKLVKVEGKVEQDGRERNYLNVSPGPLRCPHILRAIHKVAVVVWLACQVVLYPTCILYWLILRTGGEGKPGWPKEGSSLCFGDD